MTDKNVEKVITQLRDREEEGLLKYGVNTERSDLSTLEWLQHLQEELMDASVYIERLKNDMKNTKDEVNRAAASLRNDLQPKGDFRDWVRGTE